MRILLLGSLFVTFLAQAQEVEIVSLETTDQILRGSIGEEYPITMYLKVTSRSDNVGWIFGVSGWYQYDKIGTPIPVVGVWGIGGQLYLYVSDDLKFNENMKNLIYENEEGKHYLDNFIFDITTLTPEISEINESFQLVMERQRISGDWNNKDKGFQVLFNNSSNQIVEEFNYLKLPNGDLFDLLNTGIPARADFEIEASANGGRHVILNYAYHTNLNYNGRCGGASTTGKLGLVFDEAFQFLSDTQAEFVNCYRDLSVENLEKVSENVTKYRIHDYGASEETIYRVDSKLATIEKVEE